MKALSSRVFRSDETDVIGSIKAWLDSFDGVVEINVQIRTPGQDRVSKHTARQILEDICNTCVDGADRWEQHKYRFLFFAKTYYWKGKEIHLTAGEAFFLYRWLVQGTLERSEMYYFYNMRKRLGDAFLDELLSKEDQNE